MNAVDTIVLVYSVDASEPTKGAVAIALLEELAGNDTVLPWQVLCEFSAVLHKLQLTGRANVDPANVTGAAVKLFRLVMPDRTVQETALALCRSHGVSFWDALLLAACARAGVNVLYTEDVPSAGVLLGVRTVNPFVADPG